MRLRGGDLSHAPDIVVYPRHEDDVLGLLRICAEDGIVVTAPGMQTQGKHAATLACNMTGMADILSLDAMSGLALTSKRDFSFMGKFLVQGRDQVTATQTAMAQCQETGASDCAIMADTRVLSASPRPAQKAITI